MNEIKDRRSIRKYKDTAIEKDVLEKILKATILDHRQKIDNLGNL